MKRHIPPSQETQLKADLAAVKGAFQEFAYIVSHDLNAAMRESAGFATLLQEKYETSMDDYARHYLSHIQHGIKRTQAMLDGLLHYSRLSTREQPMEDGVDMMEVLTESARRLQEKIRSSGARIDVEHLPAIRGDREQLQQLFSCLLDNCLKFTAPGVAPRIAISGEASGNGWRFCVRDNGIGIAPKDCKDIFKPLRQLQREGEYPGLGMGLALAHKIIARHGGSIWVESEPSKGAAFWFTLERITEENKEVA